MALAPTAFRAVGWCHVGPLGVFLYRADAAIGTPSYRPAMLRLNASGLRADVVPAPFYGIARAVAQHAAEDSSCFRPMSRSSV